MADQQTQQPAEGQQQAAQGEQRQERRFGGKDRQQGGRGPRRGQEEEWKPVTKLGRLVKSGKIPTLDDVFRLAIPIKEPQIVDFYLKEKLKEEVVQVKPVQKQTQAGQRTRFKAYVIIGDLEGHIGLGWKCHKEVQGAIKGAIESAKLNIVPVRKGYWGNPIGAPHTVPIKIHGKCGSVRCRLIPAPRGTGLVASPTSKRVLQFAGVQDVYTASSGSTKTKGNFARAVFQALQQTYHFLTPDFWGKPKEEEHPFDANSKFLHTKVEAPVKQDREHRGGDRERRPFGGNRENRGDREHRGGDRRGGDREHRGGEQRGEQRGEPRGEPRAETRE